jgi:hypothetical protein
VIQLAGGRSVHPENLQRGSLGEGWAGLVIANVAAFTAFVWLVAPRWEVEAARRGSGARAPSYATRRMRSGRDARGYARLLVRECRRLERDRTARRSSSGRRAASRRRRGSREQREVARGDAWPVWRASGSAASAATARPVNCCDSLFTFWNAAAARRTRRARHEPGPERHDRDAEPAQLVRDVRGHAIERPADTIGDVPGVLFAPDELMCCDQP